MAEAAIPDLALRELFGAHWEQEKPTTLKALLGRTMLIAFWRSDCAPCRDEITILPIIAREHPDMFVAVIAVQDANDAHKGLPANVPSNMHILAAAEDINKVLPRFGDTQMALPFSMALHDDGRTCGIHFGVLGTDQADEWSKTC